MQPNNLYSLYTENKNISDIQAILARYFDSFILIPAQGVWKGGAEHSLLVQILTFDSGGVFLAANEIKVLNKQDAVLVVEQFVTYSLI